MNEAIDKGVATVEHPTPLLFVHGAWHGAWCWDDHFLDFFAGRGYHAVALNLRAHGGRPSNKALHEHSVGDYLDDVVAAADALPTTPVLIGHSMGGYLVQKYLETRSAPAGVLMGSVPPRGPAQFLRRWTRQQPARMVRSSLTGDSLHLLNTPDLVRGKMLSAHTPEADVVRCTARLQNESKRSTWGLLFQRLKPALVGAPLLVLGGELDDCFGPADVHATAAAYGTDAVIFPAMGHDMMLEPDWHDVAERIDAWLTARGL